MCNKIFVQKSILGRKVFYMNEFDLRIAVESGNSRVEHKFKFSSMSHEFQRVTRIHWRFIIIPAAAAFVVSSFTRFVPDRGVVHNIFVVGLVWFIVTLIIVAIRGVRPREVVEVRSQDGILLFDIIKEPNQSKECEEFISSLQRQVRQKAME